MARTTRDAATDICGQRTPYRGEGDWPLRVDERTLEDPEHWIQSACVLCSNGCGLDIGVNKGRIGDCQESCVRGHSDADGGRLWRSRKTPWTSFWTAVTRKRFSTRTGFST